MLQFTMFNTVSFLLKSVFNLGIVKTTTVLVQATDVMRENMRTNEL